MSYKLFLGERPYIIEARRVRPMLFENGLAVWIALAECDRFESGTFEPQAKTADT